MKININREIIIKLNIKKRKTTKAIVFSKHSDLKKIQTKPKSAKQKLNLINTTIEQNRTQEIVKNKWEIREKGRQTLNLN